MIKVAVCDDEPYMLDCLSIRLSQYLEARGLPYRLTRYESGGAVFRDSLDFDLLFLDIQMDPPDGLEIARLLRAEGFDGLLVFMTVLKERVFEAFDVEAFDYLLKPVDDGRFARTMSRAISALEKRTRKSVTVRKGNARRVVPLDDILFCEVLGRRLYLHTRDGEHADCYGTMEDLEQHMDHRFFRCHRSYLINLDRVRGSVPGAVILSDGAQVPVSRLREQELTRALLSHMKERRR